MNEQAGSGTTYGYGQESRAGVKETVREAKDKIKTKTKEVASQARDRGEAFVQQRKDRAADRIAGVSNSIRQTAERFEEEDDLNIARYTRLVADKLERAATYVREHDVTQLRHDGEEIIRQHPAVFFGGLFVAGFAAARFLKATAERDEWPEPPAGAQPGSSPQFQNQNSPQPSAGEPWESAQSTPSI
jgi:hypothetical protein